MVEVRGVRWLVVGLMAAAAVSDCIDRNSLGVISQGIRGRINAFMRSFA